MPERQPGASVARTPPVLVAAAGRAATGLSVAGAMLDRRQWGGQAASA